MFRLNLKKPIKDFKINIESAAGVTFGIFVLTFLAQFYICNRYAVKNDDLRDCLQRKSQLQKELAKLEYTNSLLSSLERVETEAAAAGLVPLEGSLSTIEPAPMASLNQN